ncbi:hypothetical protein GE09DRAFT_1065763 [Coniochaeta sp. 2T2.1]|nr:hypothetical protein GE09DRAFT_1065763 [Coniochaeta sp. 2T2.1]
MPSRGTQKLKPKQLEKEGGFTFDNCPTFDENDGKHLVAKIKTFLRVNGDVNLKNIEGCLAATFDNAGGLTHLLRRGVVHLDFWLAVAQATDWTMRAQDLDAGAQPTGRLARAVDGFLRTIRKEKLEHLFPSGSLGPDDKWPDAADSDDEDGGAGGLPPSMGTFTVTLLPSRPVVAAAGPSAAPSVLAAPVASAAALPSASANNNTTTTATSVAPAAPVPAAPVPAAGAAPAPAGHATVAALVPPLAAMRISRKRSNDDSDSDSDSDEQPATKLQRTKVAYGQGELGSIALFFLPAGTRAFGP